MDQLYQINRIMAEKFDKCNGRSKNGRKENGHPNRNGMWQIKEQIALKLD